MVSAICTSRVKSKTISVKVYMSLSTSYKLKSSLAIEVGLSIVIFGGVDVPLTVMNEGTGVAV